MRWIETYNGDLVNVAHLSRIEVTDEYKGMEGRWQVRGFFAADGLGSMGMPLGIGGINFENTPEAAAAFAAYVTAGHDRPSR